MVVVIIKKWENVKPYFDVTKFKIYKNEQVKASNQLGSMSTQKAFKVLKS